MIIPPDVAGVAFSEAGDGDLRGDPDARSRFSAGLGLPDHWATVRQVHGAAVAFSEGPGEFGEADALWTTTPWLPLAVFTADCFGVVLLAPGAVGVAHAGWRGVTSEVVPALRDEMAGSGHLPDRAVIGPGIGPCCFEVGPDVAMRFPDHKASTTAGSGSVDLLAAISEQLSGTRMVSTGGCTRHQDRFFSHRRDQTKKRMASLGWLP
jgi:polyphenol oxidase